MAINNATNNKAYVFNSDTTVTAGTGITATTGNIAASAGAVSASTTVTAGTNLVSTSGNVSLPGTNDSRSIGAITIGGQCFMHAYRGRNIFLGDHAGGVVNFEPTANDNVGIGYYSFQNLQISGGNAPTKCTFVGAYSGYSTYANSGAGSVGIGYNALRNSGGQSGSVAIGNDALGRITEGGGYNIGIGYHAGYDYVNSNPTSNICINSVGVTNETNTLHIGAGTGTGTQQLKTSYISGIYTTAAASSGTAKVMLIDNADLAYGLTNTTSALLTVAAAGTAPTWSTGPTISGTLTANALYATTFDTNVAAAGVTLAGTTLAADGSDTNINITVTPKGNGVVSTAANINAAGISFDSGTNTIANYKNSTAWTPDLQFGGAKVGITYGGQAGYYTRIGNIIFFTFSIVLTSKGSSTGSATIGGLPTNAASVSYFMLQGYYNTWTGEGLAGSIASGGSSITITIGSQAGTGSRQLDDTMMSDSSRLRGSGFYFV